METILIILAIVWIVIPILAKNKQKQATEQAERERVARQRAALAAAEKQAESSVPRSRSARRRSRRPSALRRPVSAVRRRDRIGGRHWGAVLEGELPHDVKAGLRESKSSLRELNVSISHVVTASSESGHTHQETSATGIQPPCPPGKTPIDRVQTPAPAAAARSSGIRKTRAAARDGRNPRPLPRAAD
jgi:hypothetical protein